MSSQDRSWADAGPPRGAGLPRGGGRAGPGLPVSSGAGAGTPGGGGSAGAARPLGVGRSSTEAGMAGCGSAGAAEKLHGGGSKQPQVSVLHGDWIEWATYSVSSPTYEYMRGHGLPALQAWPGREGRPVWRAGGREALAREGAGPTHRWLQAAAQETHWLGGEWPLRDRE